MAILKHIISGALMLVLLSGCYEDITPRIDVQPVLCLNSLITAGQPIKVDVSHTWVYTDVEASRDHSVADARISIFANGELRNPDYIPREGDEIRILVESPTYGSAEATVAVPHAVEIASLSWTPAVISAGSWDSEEEHYEMVGYCTFNISADLEFTDPAGVENYYSFSYFSTFHSGSDENNGTPLADFYPGTFKFETEPIFSEHIGAFEAVMGDDTYGFPFFTDRQISGRSYSLHLCMADASYSVCSPILDPELLDCTYEFTLHSVSKSYYSWSLYQWHRDVGPLGDLSDVGLSEQLAGYSNVSTGAGVVAAQTYATATIPLAPFLTSTLNFE